MSWSLGVSGTKAAVKREIQKAVSTNPYFPFAAAAAICTLIDSEPDGEGSRHFNVSTYGHANPDGSVAQLDVQVS